MRKLITIILAALAAAAPFPAAAQTPPVASAPVSAQAEARASELMGLMHMDQMLEQGMAQSLEAMRSGAVLDNTLTASNSMFAKVKAKNPTGWATAMQHLGVRQAEATEALVNQMKPEMVALAVRSYAAHFNVAELDGLLAFYRSPLGQKTISALPQIMADTLAWIQQSMPQHMTEVAKALQPDIERELLPLLAAAQDTPPVVMERR